MLSLSLLLLTACSSTTPKDSYAQAKLNFTEQNYYNAYQQLLVPAAKGNSDAEYALGFLYYYGKGTPVNQQLGKQWILKAAQDGNEQAAQAYQMILAKEQSIMPAGALPRAHVFHPKKLSRSKRTTRVKPKTTYKHIKAKIKPARKLNKGLTADENFLMHVRGTDFTLQLLDTTSPAYAAKFIREQSLGSRARVFHRQLNGKDLYVVVYGIYRSHAKAKTAIKALPLKVQNLKPWIRSITAVQQEIKNAN